MSKIYEQDGITINENGEIAIQLSDKWKIVYVPSSDASKLESVRYEYNWTTGWNVVHTMHDWQYSNLLAGYEEKHLDPQKIQEDVENAVNKLEAATLPPELNDLRSRIIELAVKPL